jgi:hypothetical protein
MVQGVAVKAEREVSDDTPIVPKHYDYVVTGIDANGSEIRKFADSAISAAVDKVLAASLGADDHFAIVGHYTSEGNLIQGAIMGKVPLVGGKFDFTWMGVVSHSFATGDNRAEAWIAFKG